MTEERDRTQEENGGPEVEDQTQTTDARERQEIGPEDVGDATSTEPETASEEDKETPEAEEGPVRAPVLPDAMAAYEGSATHIAPEEESLEEEETEEREPLGPEAVCSICRQPILPEHEYVVATYGPVHEEPCSHQSLPA